MIRKYHNHKPQTALWHREEEPLNHHETPGRQNKQSNQPQGEGGGGRCTLIFSYIRRLGPFFWGQIFEFQYFFGFSEK